MADSSDSEEFVSADEGPAEDFPPIAARTDSSPSGTSSPPPAILHVRSNADPSTTSSLTNSVLKESTKGIEDLSDGEKGEEEVTVHDQLDNVEQPRPPSAGTSDKVGETEDSLSPPKSDISSKDGASDDKTSTAATNKVDTTSSANVDSEMALVAQTETKIESSGMELNTGSSDVDIDAKIAEVSTIAESTVCITVDSTFVERKEERKQSQEASEKGEGEKAGDEEKAPVPPPRRKRKKKMNKQPSLENLVDSGSSDVAASVMQRSMTVSSTDFRREGKKKERQSNKMAVQQQPPLDVSLRESKLSSPETPLEGGGSEELGSPTGSEDSQVKSKPSKLDGLLDESLRSSRSVTPTPAISIDADGSLELTADMINGIDNEVITSDTLQSAKARGSNNTDLGVIIPSDDESVDGEALLLLGEEEEEEEGEGLEGLTMEEQVDLGGVVAVVGAGEKSREEEGGGGRGGEGGRVEGTAEDTLPGSSPKRVRAVSGTSEEESGHDHERTPQPSDHQERTLEPAKTPTDQNNADQTGSPTDNAILESTMIKNLDTGEVMPLSAAEERIPRGHGWSPLSEHLLRRTNQMSMDGHLPALDEDEIEDSQQRGKIKRRFKRFTKWGKRKGRHGDGQLALDDDAMSIPPGDDHQHTVKYKNSSNKQGQLEFERVRLKQDLTGQHLGAVWVMEFSICGRLLATAGQDSVVRVWVLRTAYIFFHELQSQYQRLGVHSSVDSLSEKASMASNSSKSSEEDDANAQLPFLEAPLCAYYGHTADILDLSWSKNFFLLSSSMDKTVRLWHISRKECLCCFQHVDFVTAIAFHPRDDRYFLSGSLDGKLRLWNIPDKKVALWNEIEGVGSHLITAANFCMNGKLAVVGTYDGRCIFYETEHLKYHTQIHVRSRHGKNRGRKISGVEPLPGEDKLLVTSNDSRIRLYNLKDHSLSCKYRGCLNTSSQIKATFSRDGQYIISGSEDNFVYVWKTHIDMSKMPSRRDRNEFYESFSTHSAPVTTAIFAPVPGITVDQGLKEVGEMIVAADYQGCIKIYVSNENL